jgi:uncharacterized protein DUF6632
LNQAIAEGSETNKMARLTAFLNVYGVVSVILFGVLFTLTLLDAPIMQDGGALRFMRWEPLAKHIELMLEGVYFVWGVFFFRAARNPQRYLSFIDFTIWANIVHGLIMVPQSHVIPGFHYKLVTDVAYCLILSGGLIVLRPNGLERSEA